MNVGVGLHAGTAIEVLTPEGTWQPARFEYDVATWSPLAYVALGGWDTPQAAFTIPTDAVVRLAPEPPALRTAKGGSRALGGGAGHLDRHASYIVTAFIAGAS